MRNVYYTGNQGRRQWGNKRKTEDMVMEIIHCMANSIINIFVTVYLKGIQLKNLIFKKNLSRKIENV